MCLWPQNPFLVVFKKISWLCRRLIWKNSQKCTFNGILRHMMIPNNAGLTWIFAWMCVSAILPLSDKSSCFWVSQNQNICQKCHFYGFLRHFTAFSRKNPNRIFCFWHGCMRLHVYNSPAWVTMLRNFLKVTSVRKGRVAWPHITRPVFCKIIIFFLKGLPLFYHWKKHGKIKV